MNDIDDAALAEALAQACSDAANKDFQSIVSVASALRTTAGADEDPICALIAGLEYHLVVDEKHRAAHGPFGPMMEAGGRSYPAPLDQIEGFSSGVFAL